MNMDAIKSFTNNKKEFEMLINAAKRFSEDNRIKFGIEKFAMSVIHRGEPVKTSRTYPVSKKEMTIQPHYKHFEVTDVFF